MSLLRDVLQNVVVNVFSGVGGRLGDWWGRGGPLVTLVSPNDKQKFGALKKKKSEFANEGNGLHTHTHTATHAHTHTLTHTHTHTHTHTLEEEGYSNYMKQ